MRKLTQVVSGIAIIGTILPSVLYLFNVISLDQCKWAMLVATVLWFVATPLWMGRNTPAADPQAVDPL